MLITLLKSKIHRATVTDCNIEYEGSISISRDLMLASGLYQYEKVDVLDINNGERFSTYVITSNNPGEICVNGAAARKVAKGDLVIIVSYVLCEMGNNPSLYDNWQPSIVKVDENNRIKI